MVDVYIINEMPNYINVTSHIHKKQMLHNHQEPKLTIPYSLRPEMLLCQDRDFVQNCGN